MNFSWALDQLKIGYKVRRVCWEGCEYIQLLLLDEFIRKGNYIVQKWGNSDYLEEWEILRGDLLAEDWDLVP